MSAPGTSAPAGTSAPTGRPEAGPTAGPTAGSTAGSRPVTPFELTGPLPAPDTVTVLEASAGTGKTFTIAALAARFLAEGTALSELMLVTFGRNASQELRQRVRERLVASEAALRAVLAGASPSTSADPVERLLTDGDPATLALRRGRLARALAEFDAATIATTHEFCLQMLEGLGVLADLEPNAVFVEHLHDLTREVVGDVYLRRWAVSGSPPFRDLAEATEVGRQTVEAVHAGLLPRRSPDDPPDTGGPALERADFAAEVRAEVARRSRQGRLFTYDDMQTRLRDALADPDWGGLAAARLHHRYRVVMVDEFQDTDPVQWQILRHAFVGHARLVLIGDPKQAVYGFRGADVHTYLEARAAADVVHTLDTNHRADAAVVAALNRMLGGAALGEEEIVVPPVRSRHTEPRLRQRSTDGAAAAALPPVRVRALPHRRGDPEPTVGDVRPRVLHDLVADVTAALADLELAAPPQPGSEAGWRALQPADIAVLVHTNRRGEEVRQALVAAGVPAVMLGAASVFGSDAAAEWLTLLTALEQPRQALVRRAALTPFVGWTFAALAEADDEELTGLSQRLRGWSRLLAGRGVAALLEAVSTEAQLPERVLAEVGGERRLTDLRHVAEALHAAMVAGPLGPGELRAWLAGRIAEADRVGDGSRRLETEARAVQVVTVHRSKGLEYPVVYLPDAWDRWRPDTDEGGLLRLHSPGPEGRDEPQLDVGGRSSPGRAERFAAAQAEADGESLRAFYVALTRARSQLVVWWAPSRNTPCSPLQRLWNRPPGEPQVPPSVPLRDDPSGDVPRGPGVVVEPVPERAPELRSWRRQDQVRGGLDRRRFDRTLDLAWRRTSYSALTAAVHGAPAAAPAVGSEPEPVFEADEAELAPQPGVGRSDDPALAQVSPMAGLPSGTEFGTAVHGVLEEVDPTAADLAAELRRACGSALGRAGSTLAPDQLAEALLPVLQTPLGPLAGGRRLADIAPSDRLAELSFELPLAGGDAFAGPSGDGPSVAGRVPTTLGDLAPLLAAHLPADDPLVGYPALLAHPVLAAQPLRGYLTGSIDAVLRTDDGDGPRYLVVDYKTNWLGPFDGRPLTLAGYTPRRLADAMVAAHYPLQALLYGVAVHRLLRWRQRGYDPERHLGGVLYLFVRGMAGPDTPEVDGHPCGVFGWRPPAALVMALSDLLDGRPR